MKTDKWPKKIEPLTPEQELISDDFVKYFHEVLSDRMNFYNKFNHEYIVKNTQESFVSTLEIGAGDGEHIEFESLTELQMQNYVATDIRTNMLQSLKLKHPWVQTRLEDCSERINSPDGYFDRIFAIHVLEHIPNLPAAIKEIHRVCNKSNGTFSIVIPCEGGLLHRLGRKITAERIFRKRYNQPYDWFIKREHVNVPKEIIDELEKFFLIKKTQYYPINLNFEFCNLCIGITMTPLMNE